MNKVKNFFSYTVGSILAFWFGHSNAFARAPQPVIMYGAPSSFPDPQTTLLTRVRSIVLSPIIIPIIFVLALILGIFTFFKRRK